MSRVVDLVTSFAASASRLNAGMSAGGQGPRPEKPLELYEFEACPYCRKVREALSQLDLDAHIRPCPKGGSRFRVELEKRGGKAQFPYLVDPNTGKEMYESDEIVAYLYAQYGTGPVPFLLSPGILTSVTTGLASAWRAGQGARYRPARRPERELELYSFEISPYCRLVRETLCALELPYLLHNVAKNGLGRAAFTKRSGRMMVPYLVDPNTGIEMFESAEIVRYLEETYAEPTS